MACLPRSSARNNSYHAGLAPSEARLMMEKDPKVYPELEYRYQPVHQQLNAGVWQIEIDTFADSQGGRYAQASLKHSRLDCHRIANNAS
jgi:hypothetical protein